MGSRGSNVAAVGAVIGMCTVAVVFPCEGMRAGSKPSAAVHAVSIMGIAVGGGPCVIGMVNIGGKPSAADGAVGIVTVRPVAHPGTVGGMRTGGEPRTAAGAVGVVSIPVIVHPRAVGGMTEGGTVGLTAGRTDSRRRAGSCAAGAGHRRSNGAAGVTFIAVRTAAGSDEI